MSVAPMTPVRPVASTRPAGGEPRHVTVGPLRIFDGGPGEALAYCREAVRGGQGARIATANLDFLALAQRDASLCGYLDASHLIVADGAPVAWLARLAGANSVARVAGVDLAQTLLAEDHGGPLRVALYGSTEEISKRAAERIERECGVSIVCRICPPFRELAEEERDRERALLREAEPQLVLVALGCPRQERLIAEYFECAPKAVWIGIGGTLDFFVGQRKRAPKLMQRVGLEWTVRLAQEPRRLWRRYLLRDIPALVRVAPGCLAGRQRRALASEISDAETAEGRSLNRPSTRF